MSTAQPNTPKISLQGVTKSFGPKKVLQGIGEKPRMLDTDLGNEFKGELQPYLKEQNIAHRTKDPKDLNALAVCD